MKVAKHHLGRYHNIFTDKLYTSMALAQALLAKHTYLTGAVKSTSRGLPVDLLNSDKNPNRQRMARMNKVKRGTFYSRQNGQMVVTAWKDSRVMMTLSTAHQGWRDPAVHNLTRKIPDNATGRRVSSVIAAPPQVCDYTQFMGGVDRGDQLRAYHTCSRKAQYWWKKILYFLVDIARINGSISYKQHHRNSTSSDDSDSDVSDVHVPSTKPLSHSQFVLSLGTELIDGYAASSSHPQCQATSTISPHNIAGHTSVTMPGLYPKRCRWCVNNNGVTPSGRIRTTKYGCRVCMVNLCPGACLIRFHENAWRPSTATDMSTSDGSSPEHPTKKKKKKKTAEKMAQKMAQKKKKKKTAEKHKKHKK